jgi:nitrogen fixation/metabolism regulation signal transduction histidine kinase
MHHKKEDKLLYTHIWWTVMKKGLTTNFLRESAPDIEKNNDRIRIIAWIVFLPAIFVGAFGWKSYEQSRTQWMESKVKNAIDQSMQYLSLTLPRIQITDSNTSEVYYAPDLNTQFHNFDLYGQTLITLNQDLSVPTVKLTLVSITEAYGPSFTTLVGQATVEFPLIAGINKKMIVRSSIQVPHYKVSH